VEKKEQVLPESGTGLELIVEVGAQVSEHEIGATRATWPPLKASPHAGNPDGPL